MLKKYTFTLCLFIATFCVAVGQNANNSKEIVPKDLELLYDDLLIKWKEGLKYSNDCKSTNDGTVLEHDSVYTRRLYALPTEMELAFNPIVRNYIELYAGRRKNQVSYLLAEGAYFFPMIEDILDKEGVPLELKYLPIIESALNPIARSRVGATGLWQFMAGTGRLYKLEVNSLVDERRDPVKSTKAAARYLSDMYKIYEDWNLVIAAYNCGPGNVNKAIRRSGGKRDYWAIYEYLPRETRGYVPAFIAATYIMNYYEEHNICPAAPRKSMVMDTLQITQNMHLGQISEVLKVDIDELRLYNPQFKSDVIPGEYKAYTLNMPFQQVARFVSNQNEILAYKRDEYLNHRRTVDVAMFEGGSSKDMVHRVKNGDTLSGIAKKYGVSVQQLRSWNNLKSDRLTIGRRLAIYKKGKKRPVKVVNTTLEKKDNSDDVVTTITHKVKKGETWEDIANKYNVKVQELRQWNSKVKKSPVVGRYLTILQPKHVEEPKPQKLAKPQLMEIKIDSRYTARLVHDYLNGIERDESTLPQLSISGENDDETRAKRRAMANENILYHKVRIGETLTLIARRYNVSKESIVEWNNMGNAMPRVGQRLLIYVTDRHPK